MKSFLAQTFSSLYDLTCCFTDKRLTFEHILSEDFIDVVSSRLRVMRLVNDVVDGKIGQFISSVEKGKDFNFNINHHLFLELRLIVHH